MKKLLPLALLALGSFSFERRQEIRQRAGYRSELSGHKDEPLECSHWDHSRDEGYNDAENGLLVTVTEHYIYHCMHVGISSQIGLTERQNDWSIERLEERVQDFYSTHPDLDREGRELEAYHNWLTLIDK